MASQGSPNEGSGQVNSNASTNSDVPSNLHNWTQSVMIEVLSSLTCQITGIDPINPKQSCLGADQKTGKIGFLPSSQKGGAIGFMGNMIAILYTPPLHTSDYFQNLAQNFGLNKKAYADVPGGAGFQSLSPLIGIWTVFRNIVYLILVIIFVIIGLAIMLRVKIDPRTVMTIQNQIPKIIVGILAVTFSFAIAGFLVDMMWVLIYLIYNVLTQAAGFEVIKAVGLRTGTPFGVIGAGNSFSILWDVSYGIGKTIADFLGMDSVIGAVIKVFSGGNWIEKTLLLLTPGALATGMVLGILVILQGALGIIGGVLVFIVLGIALLMALFKIWFSLLKAYVMILLDVVLAPFWIIGGVIPGSPISLTGWLKDMAANLLSFPVTIAMFMFAVIFKDIFGKIAVNQYFFPPLIGNAQDMGPSLIGAFISFGIIMITPNITNLLKQMLKAPKSDLMGGVMKGIGAGTGIVMSGGKTFGASQAKTPNMGEKGGIWGAARSAFKF